MADEVRPPRPVPQRLSLVQSSAEATAGDAERWEDGFVFKPEACDGGGIMDRCNPDAPREIPARPANVTVEPFYVWGGDKCSATGFQAADYEGRAQRLLERCQSKQIARELWEGTFAQAKAEDDEAWATQQFLAKSDADTVTDGPSGIIDGLACLEQALADCGCGARGMIHATRQVVTHWAALGNSVLRREGGLLLTAHDTIVVSDSGYTGTGPNGEPATSSIWAYATGIVHVRLAPLEMIPGEFAQALNRDTNTVEFFAQRLAAYAWDGCCHFAAEFDLEACAIGGAS